MGRYRLRARAGWYSVLIGESNVAIDPAIGGYGAADIYLGEFSPQKAAPANLKFPPRRAPGGPCGCNPGLRYHSSTAMCG